MSKQSARGQEWQAFRRMLIRKANFLCERCGRHGRLEIHHVVEVSEGGSRFDPANCEVLCRRCHIEHHHPKSTVLDLSRAEWLEALR